MTDPRALRQKAMASAGAAVAAMMGPDAETPITPKAAKKKFTVPTFSFRPDHCTQIAGTPGWKTKRPGQQMLAGTFSMVEARGLEPRTPCLQSRCATNCAMPP